MLQLLWLIPAIPFLGALILALVGRAFSRRMVAVVGVGSVAIAAGISLAIVPAALALQAPYTQVLWTWMNVAGFRPEIALYLDPMSFLMILVVTFVGFLIHLYSAESMEQDEGYSRFFAYMNLFVGSMLVLVLADNLLLLYLGWEGVGLCSYLLIGFWYKDSANGLAARKAFIVTRVGDTAMLIGLFLLFHNLGTLQIQDLMHRASVQWPAGSPYAIAAAALLLGGAVGKSAQLPLQTWLPDAMAGPTPTSALIHAATMVTAGVYLIARTHVLYSLAPQVQFAVAVVGAATLLLAGFSALTQPDIKRVLAYSTISQIGYMFLALGVGAWAAALLHFMVHAFFKALLFLAAGIVIDALHDEHNIFRMGGLRKELPIAFWTFLIGGCSLAGLPLVTAGFFSKDLILWNAWASPHGGLGLWVVGIAGVLLTALYTFRVIFVVFFGTRNTPVTHRPRYRVIVPVAVLAALSLVGGLVKAPLLAFLNSALPALVEVRAGFLTELLSAIVSGLAFATGLGSAYLFFIRKRQYADALAASSAGRRLHAFWLADWAFDWFYDRAFVRPVVWMAAINRRDAIDSVFNAIAWLNRSAHFTLSRSQTGSLRWYAAVIGAGAVIFAGVILLA
ncbi:MAG TPA: NADH-quinone oxidoreductase subunit L [Bryobacteraceae bacterium]|nr:NADH-quinone oxidoreductase subunit L [Bryobacteraceae bacterium]